VAALAFLFMLTNVLSYLLKALAWQGVFVTAWVAIALVYIALHRNSPSLPEVRRVGVRRFSGGALAWTTASVVGIALTEQTLIPLAAALAPAITVVLAGGLYYLSTKRETPPSINFEDGHEHFADALR
jgi:amino acid transporter